MHEKKVNVNWKAAAVAAFVGAAATAGIIYYVRRRRRTNKRLTKPVSSIDLEDCNKISSSITDANMVQSPLDPLRQAISQKDRGNSFFRGSHYAKAIECYTKALELCPQKEKKERARIYQNRAVALENLGQIDDCLPDLEDAIRLFPEYEKALNRRSKIYERLGRLRDALTDITTALYYDNFQSPDYLHRFDTLIKLIAQKEYDESSTNNNDNELQSAMYISTFLQSFPSDSLLSTSQDNIDDSGDAANEVVANCLRLFTEKSFEECFTEVKSVLQSNPTDITEEELSRLYLLRGTLYFLSCHEDLAMDDFTKVIDNRYAKPSVTINALIKKALLLISQEKFDDAEQAFTEALQIDSSCPDIYYHRGTLFENTERFQQAIEDFSKAKELHQAYSFAAVHKVYNEFRIGVITSFEPFEDLIKLFPRCLECHLIYSQMLLNVGKITDAERVCNRYLNVEPRSTPILMLLGMLKLTSNLDIEAKRLLNEAIKCDPKYSYAYQTLASLYIRDGNLQRALELLDSAIKYAKSRQEKMSFIATREGVRAQLNTSVHNNIPASDLFARMMKSINMAPMA